MPLPLLASLTAGQIAGLGAGTQLAGGFLNSQAQNQANMQSQMFSRQMYQQTRRDNLEFWNMQNEYNSPAKQMERLRAAGLNPNLVYGGSSGGTAGTAGSIPTPDVQPAQFRSPEYGQGLQTAGLAFMNSIYDLDIKQAQADNLRAQNAVIKQDALLRAAQIESTSTGTERNKFGFSLDQLYSGDMRKEQLRQTRTQTDLSMNEDARRAVANATSVREAAERILSMQAQRANTYAEHQRIMSDIARLDKDNILKDLEIGLRKNNLTFNDPLWQRVVGSFLGKYFDLSKSNPLNALESLPTEMRMFPGPKQ